MNPEAQRIAIAEACGIVSKDQWGPLYRTQQGVVRDCPDYLANLNAMHDAEKVLGANSREYDGHLLVIQGFDKIIPFFHENGVATTEFEQMCKALRSATAAQRAEAFLRTLGKWEDKA